jgi:hypothetical protein
MLPILPSSLPDEIKVAVFVSQKRVSIEDSHMIDNRVKYLYICIYISVFEHEEQQIIAVDNSAVITKTSYTIYMKFKKQTYYGREVPSVHSILPNLMTSMTSQNF